MSRYVPTKAEHGIETNLDYSPGVGPERVAELRVLYERGELGGRAVPEILNAHCSVVSVAYDAVGQAYSALPPATACPPVDIVDPQPGATYRAAGLVALIRAFGLDSSSQDPERAHFTAEYRNRLKESA